MEHDDRKCISYYLADEWMIVTENTHDQAEQLYREAREAESMVELSEKLRDEWETFAHQVTDLVEEHLGEPACLYVGQLLKGWGTYPFDIIARRAIEKVRENRV